MKKGIQRVIASILIIVMLAGFLPELAITSEAGIFPEDLTDVYAGETIEFTCDGETQYQTTNLIFSAKNSIGKIEGYDDEGELIYEAEFCGEISEAVYNSYGGYYFTAEVYYGSLGVIYNTAGAGQPEWRKYKNGKEIDSLVELNMKEIYINEGEEVKLGFNYIADGYNAQMESYTTTSVKIAFARDGVIKGYEPGTAEISVKYKFYQSSDKYFYQETSCIVHVVEDYSIESSYAGYYADGNDKYFNIVAYDLEENRVTGFDIKVGEETYNTGDSYEALITFPENYNGSVTVSKEGYVDYELSNMHLKHSNTIMMYPDDGNPVVQAVWIRPEGESEYKNAKLENLTINESDERDYFISYEAEWGDYFCQYLFLTQGDKTIEVGSQEKRIALAEEFTREGGPIYLNGYTANGYKISIPLRISIISDINYKELDFGEAVSEQIEEEITAVGGETVLFDIGGTLPIKFTTTEDGSVKGIIGISGSDTIFKKENVDALYKEINKTCDIIDEEKRKGNNALAEMHAKNLDKKIKKMGCFADEKSSSFGLDAKVSFYGTFDGKMVNGSLQITDIGIMTTICVSAVYTKNSYVGQVPFQWKVNFSEEIENVYKKAVDLETGELKVTIPDFTATTSLNGKLRVGILDAAEVAATVDGKLKYEYPEETQEFKDGTWTVDLQFKVGASLLNFELDEMFDWTPYEDKQIYPKVEAKKRVSRAYLENDTEFTANENTEEAYGKAVLETVKSNTYTASEPQILAVNGMRVLVWVDDNAARTSENRTCLYYTIYDEAEKTWSEPAAVADDGYADFHPVLTKAGDKVYLLWQKANKIFKEEDTVSDTAKALDIYVSEFNMADKTFGAPACIHVANESLDQMAKMQIVGDELSVVWVRNGSDIFDTEASADLYKAVFHEENGWQEEKVTTLSKAPASLAYGADGTIYYIMDNNVHSYKENTAAQLTDSAVEKTNLKMYHQTLYWVEEGCVTDGTIKIPADFTMGDYAIYTETDGENQVLVYYVTVEDGRHLYGTYNDGKNWGQPILLAREGGSVLSGVTGYYDSDDQLNLAVSKAAISDSEAVTDLSLLTVEKQCDIEISSMDYLGTTLLAGESICANVTLENKGMTKVTDLKFTLEKNGKEITSKISEVGLLPGESKDVEYMIPVDTLTDEKLTLKVYPVKGSDQNTENNELELEIPTSDISVEYLNIETNTDGSVHASALLVNRGLKDLENITLSFVKDATDGEVLSTIEGKSLKVGETLLVSQDISGLEEGELLYAAAALQEEENYDSNNHAFAVIEKPLKDEMTLVKAENPEDDEMELDKEYQFTTYEEDAATASYTVEESGFYWLIFEAYKLDENYYGGINITVYDNEEYKGQDTLWGSKEDGLWTVDDRQYYYLEKGHTYRWEITGPDEGMTKLTLSKAPDVESIEFEDMILGEGRDSSFNTLTITPEYSRDYFTFTSENPAIATVSFYEEYFHVEAWNAGTTTIHVKGEKSGVETSFKVTVDEMPTLGSLTVGEQNDVYEGDYRNIYTLQVEETGYYSMEYDSSMAIWDENGPFENGVSYYFLKKGVTYKCKFWDGGSLLITKIEPEQLSMDEYTDNASSFYHVFAPEKDEAGYFNTYGYSEYKVTVYDENYQIIKEAEYKENYREYHPLGMKFEKGKTYYVVTDGDSAVYTYVERYELGFLTGVDDYVGYTQYVGNKAELCCYWYSQEPEEELADYKWTSSNSNIASVDKKGVVTFHKAGKVTITMSAFGGQIKDTMSFHVKNIEKLEVGKTNSQTVGDGVEEDGLSYSFTPNVTGNHSFSIDASSKGQYYFYEVNVYDSDGNWMQLQNVEYPGAGIKFTLNLKEGQKYNIVMEFDNYDKKAINIDFLVADGKTLVKPDPVTVKTAFVSTTSAKVSWTKSKAADGYYVWRATAKSGTYKKVKTITSKDTLSFTNTGLTYDKTYYYKVTAYRNGDKTISSKDSNIASVKIRLATPTLSEVSNTKDGVKVTWKKVTGAKGYYIYRKVSGSWTKVGTVKSGATLNFTDKKAAAGKTYSYTVKAYAGNKAGSYNTTGKKIMRLTQPALPTVANKSAGVKVTWKKVTGAKGYYIYRKVAGGKYTKIGTVKNGNTLTFTDKKAVKKKTYYYTVQAYSGNYKSSYNTTGKKIVRK